MSQSAIKILLVEDNEGDILLTQEALEDFKFSIDLSVKRDGDEAMKHILSLSQDTQAGLPDLILLDINLPKKNGHEVLQQLKNHPDIKHIPVIILTTSSSEWDILHAYQEHCNSYIIKPVDVNDFFKVTSAIEDFWINTCRIPHKN